MPKIETINANPNVGLSAANPANYGANFFQALHQEGSQLTHVAMQLQKTSDDMEIVRMQDAYDAQAKLEQVKLTSNPDYMAHPSIFIGEMEKARKAITEQTKRAPVANAFNAYAQGKIQMQAVDVYANSLKQWHNKNEADLNGKLDSLTSEAVTVEPEIREANQAFAFALIDRGVEHGDYDPTVGEAKKQKYVNEQNQKLEAQVRMNDVHFQDAKKKYRNYYAGLANRGLLPTDMISMGIAGNHPILNADEWRSLVEINDNPIDGSSGDTVKNIMSAYRETNRSASDIDRARQQIIALPERNKHKDKALDFLRNDENENRTINAAELSAGLKYVDDYLLRNPGLPGPLGEARNKREKGRMYDEVRKNPGAARDIVKEAEKRDAERRKKVPKKSDTIQGILGNGDNK